jgi:hypothetical protein
LDSVVVVVPGGGEPARQAAAAAEDADRHERQQLVGWFLCDLMVFLVVFFAKKKLSVFYPKK